MSPHEALHTSPLRGWAATPQKGRGATGRGASKVQALLRPSPTSFLVCHSWLRRSIQFVSAAQFGVICATDDKQSRAGRVLRVHVHTKCARASKMADVSCTILDDWRRPRSSCSLRVERCHPSMWPKEHARQKQIPLTVLHSIIHSPWLGSPWLSRFSPQPKCPSRRRSDRSVFSPHRGDPQRGPVQTGVHMCTSFIHISS